MQARDVLPTVDDPLLEHQPQHDGPPFLRRSRVADRVVPRRILGNAREQRGLGERQLAGVVPEYVRAARSIPYAPFPK